MSEEGTLRAYLDANILFSASHSDRSLFHNFWKIHGVMPVTSRYAVNEVSRNVNSFVQRVRLRRILGRTPLIPDADIDCIPPSIHLVEKDQPILAAAIANQVDFLITGDTNHFGHLYRTYVTGVEICVPSEFLQRYRDLIF